MIIPFNFNLAKRLEDYEPGQHIITKEGNHKVRVLSWDAFSLFPIVATIDGYNDPYKFTREGFDITSKESFDLALDIDESKLAPEKEENGIGESPYFVEISNGNGVGTKLVEVSKEYAEVQLERFQNGLDHIHVFGYDRDVMFYYERSCKICGYSDLI